MKLQNKKTPNGGSMETVEGLRSGITSRNLVDLAKPMKISIDKPVTH